MKHAEVGRKDRIRLLVLPFSDLLGTEALHGLSELVLVQTIYAHFASLELCQARRRVRRLDFHRGAGRLDSVGTPPGLAVRFAHQGLLGRTEASRRGDGVGKGAIDRVTQVLFLLHGACPERNGLVVHLLILLKIEYVALSVNTALGKHVITLGPQGLLLAATFVVEALEVGVVPTHSDLVSPAGLPVEF